MSFLQKTFGGLTRAFYWRQFLFGLLFFLPLVYTTLYPNPVVKESSGTMIFSLLVFILMQVLYPYARFVYHGVTDFIMGNNVVMIPIIILYPFKLLTMLFCWVFSPLIAPLGLAYLYFYHSKREKETL